MSQLSPTESRPVRREALLVFANSVALDLHQRRLPRSAADLLRLVPLAETAELAGCDVHVFARDPFQSQARCGHAQVGRTFGERLLNAVNALRFAGYERIVVVGRDCPSLTPQDVAEAFARLRAGDSAVLGPAADGGCYLIGLDAAQSELLARVPWRRGADFAALRQHFSAGRCTVLATKTDLDSLVDLHRLAWSVEAAAALAQRVLALLESGGAQACNAGAAFVCEALAAARERLQLAPPPAAA